MPSRLPAAALLLHFRLGLIVVAALCTAPVAAQLIELEPGPELQVRRWPRLVLEEEPEFTPRIFVSEAIGDSAIEPAPVVPHAHGQGGCGCASCQGGATQGFPGYDELPYQLHGQCPPVVISEAWCRRPFFADVFVGALWGDDLIDGQLSQDASLLAGARLGWDFSADWGVETRFAFSQVGVNNLVNPGQQSDADLFLWDVSLVRYFNSSLRLRPYASIGLGLVDWEYTDVNGNPADDKVVGVPISIGIKHRFDDWLVFRLDLTDNIAFGDGTALGTQHNFSITGNVEIRFGGSRTSYWAWAPRRHYAW